MNTAFVLTMPGKASWNGKWSGDSSPHILVKDIPAKVRKNLISRSPFQHRWDDGWVAQIDVVPMSKVYSLIDKSTGFCGYNWMVESLIRFGSIYYARDWKDLDPYEF